MIIDVNQTDSKKKNQFEIIYNGEKKYIANLPFISLNGTFDLEKLRKIVVTDLNGNIKYKTNYKYIDNKLEEFIPLKYLFSDSQKFYQLKIIDIDGKELFSVYGEIKEIWLGYHVLKVKEKFYKCYSVEDGYLRHVMIYDDDKQIAELLKSNVVIDGKDTYRIYLKDNYSFIADVISFFALYLDRTKYNSSYLKIQSQVIEYKKSYSKVNKFYDKNWLIANFDCQDYLDDINKKIEETKENIKKGGQKILKIIGISWLILIIITIIILLIILKN